jgi:hypothetical protein
MRRTAIIGVVFGLCVLGCEESKYDGSGAADIGLDDVGVGLDTDGGADVTMDARPDAPDLDTPDLANMDAADAETTDGSPDGSDTGEDASEDASEDADVRPNELGATITSPAEGEVFEVGTAVQFVGTVTDARHPADALWVRWVSDGDELWAGPPEVDGTTSFSTMDLEPGYHDIALEVSNPDEQRATARRRVGICSLGRPETFDTELDSDHWRIYGDAFWDPGGWLEMTGLQMGRKGAIYNISDRVSPGDVSISFRIWTGGGTGADGFAMSVFDVRDIDELDRLVADAAAGGGLGYGVGGEWGDWEIDGFHVEFDTWHNVFNGDNELHTDPTPENHVGVMTDGDPGTHHLWAEIPNIEDSQWHDVTIEVEAQRIIVTLDGATIIDGTVDNFQFKGGVIGFSGTTGFYTNYHRFDELQILQECLVP